MFFLVHFPLLCLVWIFGFLYLGTGIEVYAIVYAVLIVGQVRMYMYVHSSSNSFSHIRVVIECDTLVSNLPNSFSRDTSCIPRNASCL